MSERNETLTLCYFPKEYPWSVIVLIIQVVSQGTIFYNVTDDRRRICSNSNGKYFELDTISYICLVNSQIFKYFVRNFVFVKKILTRQPVNFHNLLFMLYLLLWPNL